MNAELLQQEYATKLSKKPNVVGTAVGEKLVDGISTGEEALIVFVRQKFPDDAISAQALLPKSINGVPLDIIEVGDIVKHMYRTKVRPVRPGVSCGHPDVTCGTLGGIFLDADGDKVILSNNHVLAAEGAAKKGDPIYQPGVSDRGTESDIIAVLKACNKWAKKGGVNLHDSAIARLNSDLLSSDKVSHIYPQLEKPIAGFADVAVKQAVQKIGRTTGYTTGTVLAKNGSFGVGYDFGEAKFEQCLVMTNMSDSGDSGSIILDMDMNAVGLLFAGSRKVTLAHPIELVRAHYGLKIWNNIGNAKLKIQGLDWAYYGGQPSVKGDVITFNAYENHFQFIEREAATLSKVSFEAIGNGDCSGAWGIGLALQFSNASIKVNICGGNSFGVWRCDHTTNSEQIFTNPAKLSHSKWYGFELTMTDPIKVVGYRENTAIPLLEIPRALFKGDPIALRVGKTDTMGNRTNHPKRSGRVCNPQIRKLKVTY